jgi:hypothetical protein
MYDTSAFVSSVGLNADDSSAAGWPLADFTTSGGRGADEKLTAVLTRAEAVANGALLKRTQGIKQALPDFE